jgi:hypothetical protein
VLRLAFQTMLAATVKLTVPVVNGLRPEVTSRRVA